MTALNLLTFSPTGTCRRIAQTLASAAGERPCRFFDLTLPQSRRASLIFGPQDLLVLLFPVYAQSVPDPLRHSLSKIQGNGSCAVPIAVYGNISPGHAAGQAVNLLKKQGFHVIAAAEIPAAHSYNGQTLSIARNLPTGRILKQGQAFLRKVLASVEDGNRTRLPLPSRPTLSAVLPQKWLSHLAVKAPKRNLRKCIRCGRCFRQCPTGAIAPNLSLRNSRCIRCAACIKACGKQARILRFRNPLPVWYLRTKGGRLHRPRFYLAPQRNPRRSASASIPAAAPG